VAEVDRASDLLHTLAATPCDLLFLDLQMAIGTIIDDIASGASVLFLASTVLSYVALRSPKLEHWAERYADLVFILGLLLLVLCGLMLTWELGQSLI
jgi:hypothetical protein